MSLISLKGLLYSIVSIAMGSAVLISCGNKNDAGNLAMNENIHIQLGQSGDDILKKYPGRFVLSDHPSGAKFYVGKWTKGARGTIEVGPAETTFSVTQALSVTGNYSPSFPSENIIEWNINAGLGDSSTIMHEAARQQFRSILERLRKASWNRYIDPDAPRLSGTEAIRYAQSVSSVYGLDPDYLPTLEEWMQLPGRTLWKFWSKDAYLTIALSRDLSRDDVNQPGSYFVEFDLKSEKEQFRKLVGPGKRTTWQQELPAEMSLLKKDRQRAENDLRHRGIKIDETYRDPPAISSPLAYQNKPHS